MSSKVIDSILRHFHCKRTFCILKLCKEQICQQCWFHNLSIRIINKLQYWKCSIDPTYTLSSKHIDSHKVLKFALSAMTKKKDQLLPVSVFTSKSETDSDSSSDLWLSLDLELVRIGKVHLNWCRSPPLEILHPRKRNLKRIPWKVRGRESTKHYGMSKEHSTKLRNVVNTTLLSYVTV